MLYAEAARSALAQGHVKSTAWDRGVMFTLTNQTSSSLMVRWITYEGKLRESAPSDLVKPSATWSQLHPSQPIRSQCSIRGER